MSFESCTDADCPACELGRLLAKLLDEERIVPDLLVPMTLDTLERVLEDVEGAPELVFIEEEAAGTLH